MLRNPSAFDKRNLPVAHLGRYSGLATGSIEATPSVVRYRQTARQVVPTGGRRGLASQNYRRASRLSRAGISALWPRRTLTPCWLLVSRIRQYETGICY